MKVLQYIYFKIFQMHSRGEDTITSAGLAVITITFIFYCNIFTIGVFLKKNGIINSFINKPLEGVIYGLLLLGLNYFLFMHKNKYIYINKRFSSENKKRSIFGGVCVFVYGLISFCILLALATNKPEKI